MKEIFCINKKCKDYNENFMGNCQAATNIDNDEPFLINGCAEYSNSGTVDSHTEASSKADSHAVLLAELEEKFDCVIKITIDCLWCNAPVDSGESLYRHKAKEEIKSVLYENLSSK